MLSQRPVECGDGKKEIQRPRGLHDKTLPDNANEAEVSELGIVSYT